MEKVLVIGGTNIDYIGKSNNKIILEDSNIGLLKVSFGGVGRNIVENLARLGVDVTFISAVGKDALGLELKKELESLNVKVISPEGDYKTGGYLAIHDNNGDMKLALCDQSSVDFVTVEYLESLKELIQNFKYVVIDTNFNSNILTYLFETYREKIIFVDAISTEKGKHLLGLEQHINYLKCNKLEAETIFGKNYFDKFDKNTLIVTNGSKNVEYNKGKDIFYSNVEKVDAVNTIGAGDSFFSGFIFSIISGKDEKEAIEIGKKVANITLLAEGAVNKELTREKISN